MDGVPEFFAQRAGMSAIDARYKHAPLMFQEFRDDFYDLFRRFARAENNFGKSFTQRPVGIHLCESEVGDRRRLECPQNPVAAHAARAEFFQQLNRFGNRHNQMI